MLTQEEEKKSNTNAKMPNRMYILLPEWKSIYVVIATQFKKEL